MIKRTALSISLGVAALALVTPSAAQKPAGKPPEMKPPQQIADMAKSMDGTWTCTGKAEIGGQVRTDPKGTITHKLDLDGYWIQSSLTVTVPNRGSTHATMMTSYDAKSNKWYRMTANSRGAHATAWGTQSGNKISWEGEAVWPAKKVTVRGYDDMVSPSEVRIFAEYSEDGGKTWKFDHDVTCKK
jgi:hypothetical protein